VGFEEKQWNNNVGTTKFKNPGIAGYCNELNSHAFQLPTNSTCVVVESNFLLLVVFEPFKIYKENVSIIV
jgi:hypothetical protein